VPTHRGGAAVLLDQLHRLGLGCIETRHGDAVDLASEAPELLGHFDALLIDAPCSGLGTPARHADARWRIDPAAIEGLLPLLEGFLKDHPQLRLEQSFQLWPGQLDGGGDGFFAARLALN